MKQWIGKAAVLIFVISMIGPTVVTEVTAKEVVIGFSQATMGNPWRARMTDLIRRAGSQSRG